MSDSFVQVAPDSTGKQVDAQALVSALLATIYRQTVTVGDPNAVGAVQGVTPDGSAVVLDAQLLPVMQACLRELVCIRIAVTAMAGIQITPSGVDINNLG